MTDTAMDNWIGCAIGSVKAGMCYDQIQKEQFFFPFSFTLLVCFLVTFLKLHFSREAEFSSL
jgi:hypothetical protein